MSTAAAGRFGPGIPFGRLVRLEFRKLINTRSGKVLALLAVALPLIPMVALAFVGRDEVISYWDVGRVVGQIVATLLPVVAILSVSSEWSQRTALTTFTLVPNRRRVMEAKIVAALVLTAAAMAFILAISLAAVMLRAAATGDAIVWSFGPSELVRASAVVLVSMLMGTAFGTLIRHSGGAVSMYFVAPLIYAILLGIIPRTDALRRWTDLSDATAQLLGDPGDGPVVGLGTLWAHFSVSTLLWMVVPLAIGLWGVMRSEITSA